MAFSSRIALLAASLAALAACSGGGSSSPPATAAPTISAFTATPASITAGASSTLAWAVSGATSLSISGIGTVTGSNVSVSPAATTTYTLTATNAGGSASASTTVTVVQLPRDHNVQLSWAANREKGVNSPGGGYRVSLTGKPDVDVPYVSGATAPTSVTVTLFTGTYTMTVRAYQALDAAGGTSRTESAASTTTVVVP